MYKTVSVEIVLCINESDFHIFQSSSRPSKNFGFISKHILGIMIFRRDIIDLRMLFYNWSGRTEEDFLMENK